MNKAIYFALSALSGAAWTLVYLLIIKNSLKDKRCGMPFFALAFNLAWEFVFSILVRGGWNLQRGINLLWLIFDLIILITYIKYEKKHFEQDYQGGFWPWLILSFASALLIMLAAQAEFTGYLGAQYAAFIQKFMMSVLFIQMLKKRNSTATQSLGIASAKMIGTLAPTLLVVLARGSRLLQVLGLVIFVFDLVYLYLLRTVSAQEIKTNPCSTVSR